MYAGRDVIVYGTFVAILTLNAYLAHLNTEFQSQRLMYPQFNLCGSQ
jgi:hypothetical protein